MPAGSAGLNSPVARAASPGRCRRLLFGTPLDFRFSPGPVLGLPGSNSSDPVSERNLQASPWTCLIVEVGNDHPGQPLPDRSLDPPEILLFLGRHEGEGIAYGLCSGGAADPMDVVLGHFGDIEIHHVAELFDIDAPRGDVGGYQDSKLS
jgi:hypothetical protein